MKLTALLFTTLLLFSACKKEKNNPEPPTPPVTSVGEFYQGGLVFYVDGSGQHGYIISEESIDTCTWTKNSNYNQLISDSLRDLYYSGYFEGEGDILTNTIVSQLGSGNYAAKVCYDLELNGYSDWFLPSLGEMFLLINSDLYNSTNMDNSYYWTSYEIEPSTFGQANNAQACRLYATLAPSVNFSKSTFLKVRAIRKF